MRAKLIFDLSVQALTLLGGFGELQQKLAFGLRQDFYRRFQIPHDNTVLFCRGLVVLQQSGELRGRCGLPTCGMTIHAHRNCFARHLEGWMPVTRDGFDLPVTPYADAD
jgi:hypothetical protein